MHLGQISDDRLLAQIDSAEDLFVIPSLQDNSPNTVLESMACGVPGSLVRRNDVAALRAGIEDFLRDPSKREEMGINSRRVALQEYSPAVQARRYSEMHQSLV